MGTYGVITGVLTAASGVGLFIGPLSAGFINDHYSFGWATTFMSAVAVGAVSISVTIYLVFLYIDSDCCLVVYLRMLWI